MRGAFKKNPQRARSRENEPIVVEPLGDAPKTFTGDKLEAWKDIVDTAPPGVLTKADRLAVEIAAGLLARHRIMPITGTDLSQLSAFLGKFGMTPSDRSKVSVAVPTKRTGNPFGQID
jgi:hypothetical protein